MQGPLQALLFKAEYIPYIIDGHKRVTIRNNPRTYVVGKPVMLCCHIANFCVMADVTESYYCPLRDVKIEDLRADGFTDAEHALEVLKGFYPDLTIQFPYVTVIKWDNVRGSMVPKKFKPTAKDLEDASVRS